MKKPVEAENDSRAGPEGPYEADAASTPRGHDLRYTEDALRMLDFINSLRRESGRILQLGADLRDLGIVTNLVRDHFSGRLTTMSSLALGSGLSYSTAYRAIEDMMSEGLIVRRERTATGRSFSLHPSEVLLSRWQAFSQSARQMIESDLGLLPAPAATASKRSRRPPSASTIPPLAPLRQKLLLPRGLRGLVHADPTFMTMHAMKQHFEITLGVDLASRALSIDRLRSEIVANSERRVSAFDFVACDLPWFGEMVGKGRLLSLNEHIARDGLDLEDFLPDALASARRAGQIYGLPVMTTAELMFYRADLFSERGLEAPLTTDLLLEAARTLHDPDRAFYGVVWNGGRGTPLGHTFITTMAAHGRAVVDLPHRGDGFEAEDASGSSLRPMFDSPEALATAEYLLALMEVSPPDILTTTWYDRARLYARGSAAMAYCHTLLAHLFELNAGSPAHRRTGYLPPPVGNGARPVSPLGGYALAIPSNIAPDRVHAVWDAVRVMTSSSAAKLFVANGSLASPRFSVNRDPEIAALSPVIGVVDTMAREGVLRMWPRPPVDGISGVITIAGEEIHDMLAGRRPVGEALARAQDRATELMRRRGNLA